MIIQKFEVWSIKIPYRKQYISSRGRLIDGQGVILRLTSDTGIQGFGEASLLFPDRSGETVETIVEILLRHISPIVLGEDVFQFESILQRLGLIAGDAFSFPYSRAAVDIALHDLRARAVNLSLAQSLGGISRKHMQVGRSLSILSRDEMVEQARSLYKQGYKMLTLKGSADWQVDIERFLAVRDALGPDYPLEIDPNQAYSVKGAIALVRRLESAGLQNLEQPCAWWDLEGLKRITDASSVTVSADEAVMCPSDVMRVARLEAADMVTLKLARIGGIWQAQKMLHVAEAAGMACNLGSKHTFGVGTAALLHFAASHPYISEPLGYGSPLEYFSDDIIKEKIPFSDGMVSLPEGIGLGVTLDDDKLAKYSQGCRHERVL